MKHLNTNQEFRFNEILFEHRNKEYGAYALRNESDRILTKALFIGASLLAAISITPLIISAFNNEPSVHVPTDGPPVIINLKDPITPEATPPVQVIPQTVKPQDVKTFDDRLPDPKANVTHEKEYEKIEGAIAGVKNNTEGVTATTEYHPTPPISGTGPVLPYVPPTPPMPKVEDNTPRTKVDVEANFPGGINAFRDKVINNFDGSGFDTDGLMKTTITFIVETDGTISGLKADGKDIDFNSEAMRTIKSIRGKWVPAKVNGQNVRSYFKFPISMKFDN